MIIIFTGLPLAGKTTAVDIAREMGYLTVTSGNIIREEIKARGLEYNKENDREVAQWFHENGRERLLVERVIENLGDCDFDKDPICVDGFRGIDQVNILEELTGIKPYIVSVIADFKVRLERAQRRKRFDDIDESYLKERDENERIRGLDGIMSAANEVVDTTTLTLDETKQRFREILEKLKGI